MKIMLLLIVISCCMIIVAKSQTTVRVACVGNSITEGSEIEAGKRYPDQLQELLGEKFQVKNFGLGGRTLLKRGEAPYWNEKYFKEVMSWSPRIIVIKLGTNDSKPHNWKYKDEFEADYRAFIQAFKNQIPSKKKIYVCTPVPAFKSAWGISDKVIKEEIVPIIERVAKEEEVFLIDLYTPLLGKGEYFPDGIHPNAAGANLIADVVYQAIKPQQ
ncbi:GDSL-type esterase/lipase family protein [Pseudochryseolinea flava]|uniref:Sialate O-acetylesterase n=1 Tax=Pseudochryseolinea flava TaxID=2059302 RepID=A0A364Y1D6_9BACT|nr:GDSL-type esterase/lipase family protein [Pseudochryseolinea flava]RAW00651.1 sialate O-acetylesterase [Pseudochryseolinea flava]